MTLNPRFERQNSTGVKVGDNVETVFNLLKELVHLIDFSSVKDTTGLLKLHTVLKGIYNGTYPIKDILRDVSGLPLSNTIISRIFLLQLQVPCTDILISCAWLGMEVNCTEVFQFRHTYAGDCCIFNYIRPTFLEFR